MGCERKHLDVAGGHQDERLMQKRWGGNDKNCRDVGLEVDPFWRWSKHIQWTLSFFGILLFFFLWTDIIVSWPWRPGYIPTIYHTTITYIKEQTSLLDTKYIHPVKNHIFIKLSAWQMGGWLWRSRARHSCLRASVGFHSQAVKSGDGNCFLAYEGDTPEVWNVQLESFFL